MGIDLARFHQTFFEESFEGLDAMESALLRLSPQTADREAINGIFRAAHSIKGGAATFGFNEVSAFTHLLETLLDEMRAGVRPVGGAEIDVLLRAVDVLRELLHAARDGGSADPAAVQQIGDALTRLLATPAADDGTPPRAAPSAAPPGTWRIRFVPQPQIFTSGNDPLRILRALSQLGELDVCCDTTRLPGLADADPERCYLAWELVLRSACDREAIAEVFAWVEDECELSIEPWRADGDACADTSASARRQAAEAQPLRLIEGGRTTDGAVAEPAARTAQRTESSSIRVATEKIDSLINLVGELVITEAMLQQLARTLDPVMHEKLLAGLALLDRNTRQIQEAVMATRMLPVDFVFSRFPRVVRDLAAKLGKQVRLQTVGEATELDKSVIECIADPLTHLVRNAIDHGIERPAERIAAGKDATGTIRLSAAHQGGHIVIEVADDGRGLDRTRIIAKARERGLAAAETMSDEEVWRLIFEPGFSTAETVTDVSGRGVGMDVVKKNVDALSGTIEVASTAGWGTRITIRLPLTLAILDGMSVRVGDEVFIIPLASVAESLQPSPGQIRSVAGCARVIKLRNEYVPLVSLREIYGVRTGAHDPAHGLVVVLESGGRRIAAVVDELVGQQQVVIKSIESNYRRVPGISGATILGDGRVALITDVAEILRIGSRAQAA
ncbi:two-component system, chemotaxis family, sensor kinase CheA [Fontimonas thermophila]|uniref:Chemotaxis protein CheA n=1 Tax=Fontimonas thermophila TaxID=1076937 RepID=A0A1I2IQW9_9GAMM|nr:chemotaxis protein CheA [Fontimonas thermophila]SFF44090.1 two-component system, chemotaxis family, sensor kinase CheA [Fontimonas thermophila]